MSPSSKRNTATSTHPFPAADAAAAAPVGDGSVAALAPSANAAAGPLLLEVYDHHSPFLFPKWEFAKDEAPLMLRQERRRALTAQGESGCPDLSLAHRFAL